MIADYIIPVISLIASLGAIYFTARKQSREMDNIDADTISKLYDAIDKQEKRYDEMVIKQEKRYDLLKKDFESYKEVMNGELRYLHTETTKLRNWTKRLCKQLRDNKIEPEPMDEPDN